MNISSLYPFLRCLLGDRQVMGAWAYAESDLLSAVRSVFAFGRGPDGYDLDGDITDATGIAPDLASGDALALLCYESVLLLIGGEDGAKMVRTRELTIRDEGERKRDLFAEMKLQVYRIRDGAAVFGTQQAFTQFLIGGGWTWEDFTDFKMQTVPPPITI